MYQDHNPSFDDTIAGQSAIRKVLLARADDALSELPGAKAAGKSLILPILAKQADFVAQPVKSAEPDASVCHNSLAADANWSSERKRRRISKTRRAARSRGVMRLKFM